jgi:cation transport ATPase
MTKNNTAYGMKSMNSLHKKMKKEHKKKKEYKSYNKQLDLQLHETSQVLFETEEYLFKLNKNYDDKIDEMQKTVETTLYDFQKLKTEKNVLQDEYNKLWVVLATKNNEESRGILYIILTLCAWFTLFYIQIMFCNAFDLMNEKSMNTVNMVMIFTSMCVCSFYFSTPPTI